jgi:hypothetical protein
LAETAKPWLHIDWKESGVQMPPVGAKPQGSGQGKETIERVLPYQFDAQTTFVMEADGVHCTISLPVSEREVKAQSIQMGPRLTSKLSQRLWVVSAS